MATEAEVHYTADSVLRTFDVIVQREGDAHQSIAGMKLQLQELASMFVDLNEADKVAAFRGMYKDLLKMDNEVSMHMQALQSIKNAYRPSASPTDFTAMLDDKTAQLLASHRFDPEQSRDLKTFDSQTGGGGAGGAGDDDDDVVEEMGDATGLRMDKCPVSMKSVFELTEPVADSMGFIYEKSALLLYIQQNRRSGQHVMCPVAGTNHTIAERDLRPATELERVKRRRMFNQGTQGQQATRPSHVVYDADDL